MAKKPTPKPAPAKKPAVVGSKKAPAAPPAKKAVTPAKKTPAPAPAKAVKPAPAAAPKKPAPAPVAKKAPAAPAPAPVVVKKPAPVPAPAPAPQVKAVVPVAPAAPVEIAPVVTPMRPVFPPVRPAPPVPAVPLTVNVQSSQGTAAAGNTHPANILVLVSQSGMPVVDLNKDSFTLMEHFEVPGQTSPFSNNITSFRNAGTGAYLLQTKPINNSPWRSGHHLAQLLVSAPDDRQGQAAFKIIIR